MKATLLALLFPMVLFSQGFVSYFIGNPTNITTAPQFGICMMGGATENDNAMIWLLQRANGGDAVILRSSGSDGYNDYFYNELGVTLNSVETLVITSVAGATNPYVLDKVANAELIWFAGGDQYNYVSYFKDNALEDLLNDHINTKNAPIGGTSAGMAILGGRYFSAQNGTISSAQALADPFHPNLTLGTNDFLNVPFLENVTTDTHFDNPDRKGRLVAFMARQAAPFNNRYGIGANEYVAICIDAQGIARVFGEYPQYEEYAYFVSATCNSTPPEVLSPGQPLTWNGIGQAIYTYKVPGTMDGTNYFSLINWYSGNGGNFENWYVENGTLFMNPGVGTDCALGLSTMPESGALVFPSPFSDILNVMLTAPSRVVISDFAGRIVYDKLSSSDIRINSEKFASGMYFVRIESTTGISVHKVVKQ